MRVKLFKFKIYLCALCGFLILFFSANAYPQDDLSAFTGQKIQSVKTVSTVGLLDKDIEKECGIKRGDMFSTQAIRGCVTSFYQRGLFKDIVVDAYEIVGGIELKFTFADKIKIGEIKIKGHDYFSTKKLKSVAGLRKGDELTDDAIINAKTRISDLYRESGFFDVSVQIESVPAEKSQESGLLISIDEGKRATIEDIVLTGNKVWKDEELDQVIKIHKGDYYSEKDIKLGIQTLEKHYIDKGYLKVLISPPELLYDETKGKVSVTLLIDAGPKIEVVFKGVEIMDQEILKKELLIWKERAIDNAVLDESADRLIKYYREKGYYFATVSYIIDRYDDKNLRITFTITEGISVTIKEIVLTGNHYFTSKVLKSYLDIEEGKFLIEDVLKEDLRELTTLYTNSGFLEAKITHSVIFNKGDKSLSIQINIEEGIQTFITKIAIEGNKAFSTDDIMSRIKLREGQPFNESQSVDDLYSIQSFYVQKGFIYASVDIKSTYSPDKKEVAIDYIIAEDKPVYIGDIYLSGNTFTKGYVIRRELLIKKGDLYSYENILRSQRNILRLGIFKDLKLEPLNPEIKEYKKDMSLTVEEGYPGTIDFGIGYGDVEKFRGMFETSYRNIMGTGRQVNLGIEGSSIEQKYSIGYKEPWVFGYKMDARVNLVDLLENKISFDRRTLGLTTGVDKSFSDYVKGSVMFQYEDVRLSNVSPEAILTPDDTGKVEVATINPSLIIDRRNDPFNPSKGSFYSIGLREAAKLIGSRPQFAKVNLQSSFFYSPIRKIVFALSGRGGVAWNFGESKEVPIFERYFVGGRSTVRGYDQEKLGIPGKTIIFDGHSWNPTGGNMMVVFNGEIRFPLFKGFGMVTFVDSGNVWRKMEEFDISQLRSTAGAGIRYNTPVGPLRLDVGCKLDREVGEDKCMPHFTLGHAF